MSLDKRNPFSHKLYILGGSPCSGKSTIAGLLCEQFPLTLYRVDDYFDAHFKRCNAADQPVMARYKNMSWPEIWSTPPAVAAADEFQYYREEFGFILDDLRSLGDAPAILLEGAAFLPELVNALSVAPQQVYYLVPERDFQIAHYAQRPWIESILAQCTDPQAAFENWMERDHLFGAEVIDQAGRFGYPWMVVDGSLGIPDIYKIICAHFSL